MIEVGKLRYGDRIVPVSGASGYVYVYLGRPRGDERASLLIIGPHVKTQIVSMWVSNPAVWEKVP